MSVWRLRFSRHQRLRRRRDFKRVFARRTRAGDGNLLLYGDLSDLGHSRLAVVVSRRLGRAVSRNLLKRRIREAFRINQSNLPHDLDIICIPRPGPPRSLDAYTRSLQRLLPMLRRRLVEAAPSERNPAGARTGHGEAIRPSNLDP